MQIALELEASADGAKAAAGALPDKDAVWPHVQKMYSRFQQATFLERIQRTVYEAMAAARQG